LFWLVINRRVILLESHATLFVLFNSAHLVVLSAIWTLPLLLLHLEIIALVAYLVFTVAWVELFLVALKIGLAHITYVISSRNLFFRVNANSLLVLLQARLMTDITLLAWYNFYFLFFLYDGFLLFLRATVGEVVVMREG